MCEAEREWFMEDENEKRESYETSKRAYEDATFINEMIQWASIISCAICCPICIGMCICKCLRKSKKERLEEELRMAREGIEFSSDDEQQQTAG